MRKKIACRKIHKIFERKECTKAWIAVFTLEKKVIIWILPSIFHTFSLNICRELKIGKNVEQKDGKNFNRKWDFTCVIFRTFSKHDSATHFKIQSSDIMWYFDTCVNSIDQNIVEHSIDIRTALWTGCRTICSWVVLGRTQNTNAIDTFSCWSL